MEAYTIELRRASSALSWGFRLQGGADFSTPLSVQTVHPESIAALAGLCAGDGVLQINGKNADLMEHEQAKEEILRSGDHVVFLVQRGAVTTWKPKVTPLSELRPAAGSHIIAVTGDAPTQKTSLAASKLEPQNIGSSHNRAPRPFGSPATYDKPHAPMMVHAQYNTPLSLYSAKNVTETFSQQAETVRNNMGIAVRDAPALPSEAAPSTAASRQPQLAGQSALPSQDSASRASQLAGNNAAARLPSVQPQKEAVLSSLRQDGQFRKKSVDLVQEGSTGGGNAAEPPLYKGGSIKSKTFRLLEQEMDNGTVPKNGTVSSPTGSAPGSTGSARSAQQSVDSSSKWCFVCGGFITGVFVRLKGNVLHGDCLRCQRCKISLKNIGYFWVNDNIYCEQHARDITRPPGGGYTAYVVDVPPEPQPE